MTDLAGRLGTSPSAVYKHLSGRGAIIEALRERVVVTGMLMPPLDGSDWTDQVSAWMHSYRNALARHPRLIPLLTETTMTSGSVLRGYDRVAALLRDAGVPPARYSSGSASWTATPWVRRSTWPPPRPCGGTRTATSPPWARRSRRRRKDSSAPTRPSTSASLRCWGCGAVWPSRQPPRTAGAPSSAGPALRSGGRLTHA